MSNENEQPDPGETPQEPDLNINQAGADMLAEIIRTLRGLECRTATLEGRAAGVDGWIDEAERTILSLVATDQECLAKLKDLPGVLREILREERKGSPPPRDVN